MYKIVFLIDNFFGILVVLILRAVYEILTKRINIILLDIGKKEGQSTCRKKKRKDKAHAGDKR